MFCVRTLFCSIKKCKLKAGVRKKFVSNILSKRIFLSFNLELEPVMLKIILGIKNTI